MNKFYDNIKKIDDINDNFKGSICFFTHPSARGKTNSWQDCQNSELASILKP